MWGIGEGIPPPVRSDYTSEFGVATSVSVVWVMKLIIFSYSSEAKRLFDSLPARIACVHHCFYDTPLFQLYRALMVLQMNGANNKMRLQTHLGNSCCEVRYRLLGYGIPVDRTSCPSIRDQSKSQF
jgi:hypothetical protein